MKTKNIKTIAVSLAVIATISFSSLVKADELTLPVITAPAALQEGIERQLTPAQIADLLPWAKDSKMFLNDLLEGVQGLSSIDRNERLVEGIQSVVGESGPKNSELLMRYVLNRALVVNDLLARELGADVVGTIDAKNRVLISSIKMAIKYYDTDMQTLTGKSKSPFALFGNDYFNFLNELNKSVFDASAQYNIQRTALEWLQWDLYRDLNNASFAPQIVKINNSLKIYPTKKLTDAQSIAYIRQMKAVAQQLKLTEVMSKLESDRRLQDARNEEERQRILRDQQAERDRLQKEAQEEDLRRKYGSVIETVQSFSMPSINGVYLSSQSNVNGACIALGFQKAAGSQITSNGNVRGALAIVDSNGQVINAEIATDRVGAAIDKITCLNKFIKTTMLKIEKVSELQDRLGANISNNSHPQGVCKLLGYESGVNGSGVGDGNVRGALAIVDANGVARTGEVATDRVGAKISSILCVNKLNSRVEPTFVVETNPAFQGVPVSNNSNVAGVCKRLGHRGGAEGSATGDGNVRGSMLVIDVTGAIINNEIATDRVGAKISQMICTVK